MLGFHVQFKKSRGTEGSRAYFTIVPRPTPAMMPLMDIKGSVMCKKSVTPVTREELSFLMGCGRPVEHISGQVCDGRYNS